MSTIREYLDRLKETHKRNEERYSEPPEPPRWRDESAQYRMWREPSQLKPLPEPRPLQEVREGIGLAIQNYVKRQDDRLLLVRVPPGTGKTTAAVNVVQDLSESRRVLYSGPRHDFFGDICFTTGCDPSLWYEWLPYSHRDENKEPDMCRYADEIIAWLNRGYPAMDFCKQVCRNDGWMSGCPYRLQRKRKEPIIFGMHEHLITGMAISDYGLAVCDEMPLGAFLKKTRIPASGILVPGATRAISLLLNNLHAIAMFSQNAMHGRVLMDSIGPILADVYAEIEVLEGVLPEIQNITTPDQAYDAPYFYLLDMLEILSQEYHCWNNGWKNWISRVMVSEQGILLLSRHQAKEKWREKSPLICLDATGSAAMYRRIFGRDVVEYAPQVKRPGRVFQITGRLNGVGQTLVRGEKGQVLTKKGIQMLEVAEMIAEEYEGRKAVVTFKGAEHQFMRLPVFEGNVRHFGDIRGTNDLETAKVLIIAGGYCPNVGGVYDLAAALNPKRMNPFLAIQDGKPEPPWSREKCEYRMRNLEGQGHWRNVSGFWHDPDLRIVLEEFRRNEIVQAIHRARPNLQASDVWVLTSIPTDEPLDDIYENPSKLDFTPTRQAIKRKTYTCYQGVSWELWLVLRFWLDRMWDQADETGEPTHITKEMIAKCASVTPGTVESQRWLDTLDTFYRDHRTSRLWKTDTIKLAPHGVKTKVLIPYRT